MKKICLIASMLVVALTMQAQHQINSFFDTKGAVRLETQELDRVADTLVSVFHRADDVVWSRVVYRVIDMRYKQNYQLYFPLNPEDPQYRPLFRVMLDGLADGGLNAYAIQSESNIKPLFDESLLLKGQDLVDAVSYGESQTITMSEEEYDEMFGPGAYQMMIAQSGKSLFTLCNPNDSSVVCFRPRGYQEFARNQLKFLIQEVIFFDKHYSRLFSKIVAIAPLYAPRAFEDGAAADEMTPFTALSMQILWWCPFDEFRRYMARQYMIPQSNDTKRVTFDEFFGKRLYSSYLIGDSNMYDRMFVYQDQQTTEEEIRKEQERVATELLNLEQDLWEY